MNPSEKDFEIFYADSTTSPQLILGDIVAFATREHEQGLTKLKIVQGDRINIYNIGQTQMTPPMMVVVEIVKEDIEKAQLFNEKTGGKMKDPFKVRCMWFAEKTGSFQERWFNIGVLVKVEPIDNDTVELKKEINEIVVLRTQLYANKQRTSILKNILSTSPQQEEIKYSISRTFSDLGFIPPKMVIIGTETKKEMPPVFDKKTGNRKRYLSKKMVKCMWYDYTKGKYSEHLFSEKVLMPIQNISIEEELQEVLSPTTPVQTKRNRKKSSTKK